MDCMDHFFESIASLMSNLLRTCVENSIYDLVDLLEEYFEGNKYEGEYHIFKDLALPEKIHPVVLFLVGVKSISFPLMTLNQHYNILIVPSGLCSGRKFQGRNHAIRSTF